jgi:endonuclease/exonuclease/phosphatase family metal-dependent hydrolase
VKNPSRTALFFIALMTGSCLAPSSALQPAAPVEQVPFVVPAQAPAEVRVLSYNVFLRPGPVNFLDEARCRAGRIGNWLNNAQVDIVALAETFEPGDVSTLVGKTRSRFPYRVVSQPEGSGLLGVSGGLSILSRWPIEETRTLTYDECSGALTDCVANKGAVHAVVRVSENARVNVVATHLDAGSWDGDREARAAQLRQLREFIDEIDTDVGPVLVLGDFNIDALAGNGEYQDLLAALDVGDAHPAPPSTLNCRMSISCDEPTTARRLDYVFTGHGEDRLVRKATRHLPLADDTCGSAHFLSDHRAVLATFDADL